MRRGTGGGQGRSQRATAALSPSPSHTVGCQWFPWGRRGLAARRSLSEESCASLRAPPTDKSSPPPPPPPGSPPPPSPPPPPPHTPSPPRVRSPSSCSHRGQPSCRILQEAQMFQLSRHGSFCSQESYRQAYMPAGADGAKHSSLPSQRCEGPDTCPTGPDEGTSSSL